MIFLPLTERVISVWATSISVPPFTADRCCLVQPKAQMGSVLPSPHPMLRTNVLSPLLELSVCGHPPRLFKEVCPSLSLSL